jgi:hypothetical protein
VWLKYRTSFSHGYGKWFYKDLSYIGPRISKENLEAAADELTRELDPNSEHYHGIQYIKVKRPPKKYLQELIYSKREHFGYLINDIKELEKLVK